MPPKNAQLLASLVQRENFTDFRWDSSTRNGATGNPEHKAMYHYQNTLIFSSLHWHRTIKEAKEDVAFYLLPVITEALRGSTPVSVNLFREMRSYAEYVLSSVGLTLASINVFRACYAIHTHACEVCCRYPHLPLVTPRPLSPQ